LSQVEQKLEKLLSNGYEHGYMVHDDGHNSHAVRAMVPRGHQKSIDHALMLERGWWSDWWNAVVAVGEAMVDLAANVVHAVVTIAMTVVKAVAEAFNAMVDAVTDALKAVASALLKATIGCDPISNAVDVVNSIGTALPKALKSWIEAEVMPNLADMERNPELALERAAVEEQVGFWEKAWEAFTSRKHVCYLKMMGEAEAEIQEAEEACERKVAEEYELDPTDADYKLKLTQYSGPCRADARDDVKAMQLEFDRNLATHCPDITKPEIPDGLLSAVEDLEREDRRYTNLEREARGLEPMLERKEVEMMMERDLGSIFTSGIKKKMKRMQATAGSACDALYSSKQRRSSVCGCSVCPCQPATCLSLSLEIGGGLAYVSGAAGGELGCCYSDVADKKLQCFYALGVGLSMGVGQAGAGISGAINVQVLRDIADVRGEGVTIGLTVGDWSLAGVLSIGGDNAPGAGNSAERWMKDVFDAAFVGVLMTKSVDIADITKKGFRLPKPSTDLGISIDVGYGFGWGIDTGFGDLERDFERKKAGRAHQKLLA